MDKTLIRKQTRIWSILKSKRSKMSDFSNFNVIEENFDLIEELLSIMHGDLS